MAAKGKETHCVTKLMPKLSFWSQSLEIEILSCGYYGSLETMFNIGPTSRGDYNAVQRQRSLLMFCPALLMMVRICTNQAIFGLPWSFGCSWRAFGGPWAFFCNPRDSLVFPWVSFWRPWGSLWSPQEAPGVLGDAKRHRKHKMFARSVWGMLWGVLGVILVVWGGPSVQPRGANVDISLVLVVIFEVRCV